MLCYIKFAQNQVNYCIVQEQRKTHIPALFNEVDDMITLAIDDLLPAAREISDLMEKIDPKGQHEADQDAEKALKKIMQIKPDIVWLDIEMPGMNGLELSSKIKQISPFTNIVFVTGHIEYAYDAIQNRCSGFLLKPVTEEKMVNEIAHLRRPVLHSTNAPLRVQCFGNFEVFDKQGNKVHFSRQMGKEALAYLINRRGASVSVGELCGILWEERFADGGLKSQCRTMLRSLKMDLKAVGAEDVLVKDWNAWSIDGNKVDCDYYNFLRGDSYAVNSFRGEYMAQYSWAEMTIGNIVKKAGDYFEFQDD